jgi:hypothetical protein
MKYEVPSPKDAQRFERALGRLTIAWAEAEAELYRVLVNYSETRDPIARALFSGLRARDIVEYIRAIAHNTEMAADRVEDLEYVFEQLSAINTMRDHLVHHATDSFAYNDPKKRVVAKRKAKYGFAVGYEIGAETIDAMTYDLYGIHNHLNMHWGPRTGPFRPWREESPDDPPTQWTYKPLNPVKQWEKIPPGSRRPKKSPRS